MTDLVDVIWGGPFEAHDVNGRIIPHGGILQVTPDQAKTNPAWYQPIPAEKPTRAPSPVPATPVPEAAS